MRFNGYQLHRIRLSDYSREAINRIAPMFAGNKGMLVEIALTLAGESEITDFRATSETKFALRTDWTKDKPMTLGSRLEWALRHFDSLKRPRADHSFKQYIDWPQDVVIRAAFSAFRDGKSLAEVQSEMLRLALNRIESNLAHMGEKVEIMGTAVDLDRFERIQKLAKEKGLDFDAIVTWEVARDA